MRVGDSLLTIGFSSPAPSPFRAAQSGRAQMCGVAAAVSLSGDDDEGICGTCGGGEDDGGGEFDCEH